MVVKYFFNFTTMEYKMNIKNIVSNGKKVTFLKYQNDELWYITEDGFEFPVPLDDTGNASFNSSDKALIFMRWIRKHIEKNNLTVLKSKHVQDIDIGEKVIFSRYQSKELWYTTEDGFEFPVPLIDISDTVLNAIGQKLKFTTWINNYTEEINKAKAESFS